MNESNMPPGVTENMIPGNEPMQMAIDQEVERLYVIPKAFVEFLHDTGNPLYALVFRDMPSMTQDQLLALLAHEMFADLDSAYSDHLEASVRTFLTGE